MVFSANTSVIHVPTFHFNGVIFDFCGDFGDFVGDSSDFGDFRLSSHRVIKTNQLLSDV